MHAFDLIHGDCLDAMATLADGSVDMVLADLPYGTTANKWDTLIPMDKLWAAWKRVCKPGAPMVLFTQQPFTTVAAASNLRELRTEWIWEKPNATGFLNANRYPLKAHENILVFCDRAPRYIPQMSAGRPYRTKPSAGSTNYRQFTRRDPVLPRTTRYPRTVVKAVHDRMHLVGCKGLHPTQKPTSLCEYLIRTYSQPGDVILHPTMGSGTAGVAALNTGRRFIGIERDAAYFAIARERIEGPLAVVA